MGYYFMYYYGTYYGDNNGNVIYKYYHLCPPFYILYIIYVYINQVLLLVFYVLFYCSMF